MLGFLSSANAGQATKARPTAITVSKTAIFDFMHASFFNNGVYNENPLRDSPSGKNVKKRIPGNDLF
jgi:hypothetical protein